MHIDLSAVTEATPFEISRWLRPMLAVLDKTCASDGYPLDLRLVCFEDGALQLLSGDVCYDTHHGIACGVATLDGPGQDLTDLATELALDLLDQLAQADL